MENISQEQPTEQKPSVLEEFEFGVGGILLGVGTFLLMLFVLNYFNLVSLSLVFPKYFSWLPHRQVAQRVPPGTLPASQGEALRGNQGQLPSPTPPPPFVATLETCDVKKEGNPLVESVKTIKVKSATGSAEKEIIVGTFLGNINAVNYDTANKSAKIELIAPRGDQVYTFKSITEEEGLVRDDVLGKDATLADLKRAYSVFMSFNCDPSLEKEKQFRITRISVTGKL